MLFGRFLLFSNLVFRECLTHTDLRSHLTTNLRQVLDAKLLHPGVNTADILTAYIAAIRALRVLDGR